MESRSGGPTLDWAFVAKPGKMIVDIWLVCLSAAKQKSPEGFTLESDTSTANGAIIGWKCHGNEVKYHCEAWKNKRL